MNLRRNLSSILLLGIFAGGLFTVALFLLNQNKAAEETPSELGVEEVYRRAEQMLVASDAIYYAEINSNGDGIVAYKGLTRLWIDPASQVAREEIEVEYVLPGGEQREATSSTIYTITATYRVEEDDSSRTRPDLCYDAGLAASRSLGCPGFAEDSSTSVVNGSFDGRDALVLIKEGTSTGSDETFTFIERLYLNPDTYLPLATESEGEVDFGEKKPTYVKRSYQIEWLSVDSLPEGFFEPTAIGFVEEDPEVAIRNADDLQVYWLGREFSAPGVEPLVLMSTYAAPGRGQPYRYSLTYVRASAPYDPPILTLQIFFRDMWNVTPGPANQAAVIGDTVVLFVEGTLQGSTNRILTDQALEQLKDGLRPYP